MKYWVVVGPGGGGSPYKISVAHARRKSADIGLHFPTRRGPASAAFRVYFSSAAEKKGMIIHKYFIFLYKTRIFSLIQ